MRDVQPREIQYYRTSDGQIPFIEWGESIRNTNTQSSIQALLERHKIY